MTKLNLIVVILERGMAMEANMADMELDRACPVAMATEKDMVFTVTPKDIVFTAIEKGMAMVLERCMARAIFMARSTTITKVYN